MRTQTLFPGWTLFIGLVRSLAEVEAGRPDLYQLTQLAQGNSQGVSLPSLRSEFLLTGYPKEAIFLILLLVVDGREAGWTLFVGLVQKSRGGSRQDAFSRLLGQDALQLHFSLRN